jgi:ligand-binding sensor domain-containing protein
MVTGGESCATDSLAVTVSGLPDGVSAKVTVNGALDLSNLVGSETLKLATGMYTVTADPVTMSDPIVRTAYKATVSAPNADVHCGSLLAVSVTYALIPTSNHLWIGSENSDNDTFGYASASLAASGAPDADVAASTAGSLPGAFDRDGNLWVIDNTGGTVGVKRYPADVLAAGGSETPDIIIGSDALSGGVPGPTSIAFDGLGNLWLGVGYSNQVVEFAAADLAASTDSATPAVAISGVPAPAALAFDGKGNLWVGSGDQVLEYTADTLAASSSAPPATTIDAQTPLPVVGALANVRGLAFNGDGALWVNYDGTLALLTALESGTVTPDIQVQPDVLALPEGIALDERGGLWMAYSAGKFCKFSASQLTASGMLTPAVVISGPSLGSVTSPAFFPAPARLNLYASLK